MTSQLSDISRQSLNSQALHKSAYQLNDNKLYRLIEDIDDDTMHKIWGGFGLHISRQMRMGRGVQINKFGLFTFGPTEFNKDGFTSQKLKEKQQRQPVFLISSEFAKGMGLKQSVYSEMNQQIRPYSLTTSGQIQQVSLNYSEISNLIQVDPLKCKAGITRMLSSLANKIIQTGLADLEIPGIGYLIVRNNMCAVNFYPSFIQSTSNSVNLPLDERKEKGEMTLTAANLNILEYRNNFSSLSPEKISQNKQQIEAASSANQYLQSSLGINLQNLIANQKKNQQQNDNLSISMNKQQDLGEKSVSQRSFVSRSHIIRDLSNGKRNQQKSGLSQRSYQTASASSEIYNQTNPLCQRIIQFWMRQNNLDSERGFILLCDKSFGHNIKNFQFIKLDKEQFKQCIEQNGIKLTPELIEEAFKILDERGKNFIEYVDWQRVFGEYLPSQIKHLDYIRDVVFKKGLRTDDILKTMKLSRDSPPLNKKELSDCLKLMCISLNQEKAEKIADVLLQIIGQKTITVQQLTKQLQSIEEDDKEHDPTWYKNLLWRLKLKFSNQAVLEDLKEKFTNYDESNEGYLDVASFKICLVKSQLKLSISEINRMIRYIQKDNKERIDYFQLLESISTIETTRVPKERIFDRSDFLQKLKAHYEKFESAQHFLKAVNKNIKLNEDSSTNQKVTFQKLAHYLQSNLFQDETSEYLESFIKQIDYGKDGLIDVYDIQSFIKNGKYIDQVAASQDSIKQNPIQTIKYLPANHYDSKKIEVLTSNLTDLASSNNLTYKFTTMSASKQNDGEAFVEQDPPSFPINPLSEEKVNLILRDLRRNVDAKKLTFRQLFEQLDTDKNGMISCNEFMTNLDNFIQLSQPIKDGFFAYIDKLHIGMIDINSFLRVLEKSVINNTSGEVTEDNWIWQNQMIQKLYAWYLKGNFPSEEEAFRALDFEYKGYIDIQDLKKFIRDVLKIKESELTEARVNRLFKIIDFYKSGRIGIIDFTKFIQQQKEMQNIVQVTKIINNKGDDSSIKRSTSSQPSRSGKPQSSKSNNSTNQVQLLNVDWKKSAQQQLGLFISKNYSSIADSFDNVSQYQNKITIEKFNKWLELNNAVSGFDLTQTLLQELFAYFDPHKKGFLTESDWQSAFGHINWRKQMVEELRNLIEMHFSRRSQVREGFEFFLARNDKHESSSDEKVITLKGFYQGINYLYPGRFQFNDISEVWDKEINFLLKPGMDYNMFLGFLKKTVNSVIGSDRSQSGKANNLGSLIFQSQQNIAKQIKIFPQNSDSNRYRSFTPITLTGSRVSQSPKKTKAQETSLKYVSSGLKYVTPTKKIIGDLKYGQRSDSNGGSNGQQLLSVNNQAKFFNDRYNALSKNYQVSASFGINSTNGQQNSSSAISQDSFGSLQQQGEQIIQKVKRILRSSFSSNLEETLRKYDEAQSGFLTNLQLKKAINDLNLGLKNSEIFFFINLCGLDGRVEIKKLLQLLQKSQEDELIVQRCKGKLKQISNKIYTYMISPIDAFRSFNSKGDGKMNLQEFEALIKQLSILSADPQEGFAVIKDMFGFLDRNQDGFIDSYEWNDVLSNIQTSQGHFGKVPLSISDNQQEKEFTRKKYRSMSSNAFIKQNNTLSFVKVQEQLQQSMSEKKDRKQQKPIEDQERKSSSMERNSIFRINNKLQQIGSKERESSTNKSTYNENHEIKDYDFIINVLARNRKYLMDLFHSYNQANIAITYELAKSLIMKVLNSQGIKLSDQNAHQFIKFAERDGIVDYRLLLDIYKDRQQTNNQMIKV